MRDTIQRHFESNGYFTDAQHGGRARRSCVSQLLQVLESVCSAMDDPDAHGMDMIYLDLRRAFDTVQIPYLIEKLRWYGIRVGLLTSMDGYRTF